MTWEQNLCYRRWICSSSLKLMGDTTREDLSPPTFVQPIAKSEAWLRRGAMLFALEGCTVGSVSIDRNPTYESCWATGKTQRFNHFLHWTKYPTHYTPYTPYTPYPARRTSIKDHKGCFFYVKTCKGTEPRMSDFSTLDTWATFINLPVIFKAKSLIKNHTAYFCPPHAVRVSFNNLMVILALLNSSQEPAREAEKLVKPPRHVGSLKKTISWMWYDGMLSKISKVMGLRSVYSWNMSTGSGRAKSHPWSTCLATWQPSRVSGGITTFSRNFMWASAHVFSNRSQLSLFFFIGSKFWCLPLVGLEQQWLGSRSCAGHSKGRELSNFKPTRSQSLQAQSGLNWLKSLVTISIFYSSHSDHPKMSQFNAPEQ